MDLFGQEPEAGLLRAFISGAEDRVVVDAGAGRGGFTATMLTAGADHVHAVESSSENRQILGERFGDEPRVSVHDSVPAALPSPVGVLRIAGQGSELELLAETGGLQCDVVLVEHPRDRPGPSAGDIAEALRLRGFPHCALVGRQGGSPFVLWDDVQEPPTADALLIFVHGRALGRIASLILEFASRLSESRVARGEQGRALELRQHEALESLTRVVLRQAAVADERLEAIEELIETVIDLTRERDIQAHAAAARLAELERLAAEECDRNGSGRKSPV